MRQSATAAFFVYVTGGRSPATGQIGDDAVRPMYDHLRALGHVPRLDVLIYSQGGAIDVPWRMVSAFRQISDEWNINFELQLQLPQGAQLPEAAQQALQQMMQQGQQQLLQEAQRAVQEALRTQAPLQGVDVAFRGSHWEQTAQDGDAATTPATASGVVEAETSAEPEPEPQGDS